MHSSVSMHKLIHKAKGFVADKVIKPAESIAAINLKKRSRRKGFTFHTKVPIKNPLCFTVPIGKFTYIFKTGGREIGSGTVEDPGSLTARSTTWLEVEVRVPFDILLSLIKDVAADWDFDYEMDVSLIFDILCLHDLAIPVTHAGTMKLPTNDDIADFLTGDNSSSDDD